MTEIHRCPEIPGAKECPFCGLHLKAHQNGGIHPSTATCFLSGLRVFQAEMKSWNSRPAAPDDAKQAAPETDMSPVETMLKFMEDDPCLPWAVSAVDRVKILLAFWKRHSAPDDGKQAGDNLKDVREKAVARLQKALGVTEDFDDQLYLILCAAVRIERLQSAPDDGKGQPVAWMIPRRITTKNAVRHNVPPEWEGMVGWEASLIGDANPVTDKDGVTHKPYPLFAHPAPQGWQQGAARDIIDNYFLNIRENKEFLLRELEAILKRHHEGK